MKITILNISEHGTGLATIIFNSEHHQPSQSIVYPLTPQQVQELIPGTEIELDLVFSEKADYEEPKAKPEPKAKKGK